MSSETSATIATILESDATYAANMAALVHRHRQHKVNDHTFGHYQDWLMRSALRRRGLSLQDGMLLRRTV